MPDIRTIKLQNNLYLCRMMKEATRSRTRENMRVLVCSSTASYKLKLNETGKPISKHDVANDEACSRTGPGRGAYEVSFPKENPHPKYNPHP